MSKTDFNTFLGNPRAQVQVAAADETRRVSWRVMSAGLLILTAVLMAACTKNEDKVFFNGKFFPASAKADSRADRKAFTVSVRKTQQDTAAALEAGRHEGTSYCLKNFGTSDIVWTQGPDDKAAPAYFKGGRLTLKGSCQLW